MRHWESHSPNRGSVCRVAHGAACARAPWSRWREADVPRASRAPRTRLHPGLHRTCPAGPARRRPNRSHKRGTRRGGRRADQKRGPGCGLWSIVAAVLARLQASGARLPISGFWMGGKWLWGLALRGFSEIYGTRLSPGWRGGFGPKVKASPELDPRRETRADRCPGQRIRGLVRLESTT
jgi:hypothetical protein